MSRPAFAAMNRPPAIVPKPAARHRKVVCYAPGRTPGCPGHEDVTRGRIAEQLAGLLSCEAGGDYEPCRHASRQELYFVPSDALERRHAERELGIGGESDLFGGVVPQAYVATKIITHALLGREADAPEGWSEAFAERVADAVLPGYSVFTRADARRAALLLLERGPVRFKPARETGGRGQLVVRAGREVNDVLARLDDAGIGEGLVVEQNLEAVSTLSVGQVRVGGVRASYHGVQRLTLDHGGAAVYGGSDLFVVRGGYDELLATVPHGHVQTAIEQAKRYDEAADACFSGFYASRRNYDIAQGRSARGVWLSGVLEQSWRIGGASGAEVCALEAFAEDPGLTAVRAASTEVYGDTPVPPGARLYYQGEDPRVGRITKYVAVAQR
jgi:hypothetical protein